MTSENVEPDNQHKMVDTNRRLEFNRTSKTTKTTTDRTTQVAPGADKVSSKTTRRHAHTAPGEDIRKAPVGNCMADPHRDSR